MWKHISGCSNNTGKVISQDMNESEMGYRVSKSFKNYNSLSVKEQRVDGSYLSLITKPQYPHIARAKDIKGKLRCTLMACENRYQIEIPSNLKSQSKLFYSTNTQNIYLNPWFVTGFIYFI